MAGFKKAVANREYMKAGFYGKTGSGKSLTALLLAEALAKMEGKRVAYVDTERGTAFYIRDVPERTVHPAAFDIDIIETKSLFEVLSAIEELDTNVYGCLVIDSMTAMWEAAKATYNGKLTSKGGIPVQAWGPIKKPYLRVMSRFMDLPVHALICGREGVEMEQDEDGEAQVVGKKMKVEGSTAYEPHILVQMVPRREEDGTHRIRAFFEKDRSGILSGKTVDWPTAATFEPIIRILSGTGATGATALGTPEENANKDIEAAAQRKESEDAERKATFDQIRDAILKAESLDALKAAWGLTQGKKTKLGEELFSTLETVKDGRKAELIGKVV